MPLTSIERHFILGMLDKATEVEIFIMEALHVLEELQHASLDAIDIAWMSAVLATLIKRLIVFSAQKRSESSFYIDLTHALTENFDSAIEQQLDFLNFWVSIRKFYANIVKDIVNNNVVINNAIQGNN